jgi:hypothetical protein
VHRLSKQPRDLPADSQRGSSVEMSKEKVSRPSRELIRWLPSNSGGGGHVMIMRFGNGDK